MGGMPAQAVAVPQTVAPPFVDPPPSPHKRPTRTPGLVGTNTVFLIPDNIRRKFMEGWWCHIPLTYLTDKGCLLKNKNTSQDLLSYDLVTGKVVTTSKALHDNGELELMFGEWHQAWRRLLDLIKTYLPEEFLLWEIDYLFILNSENRAELWPLYLAYDADICRRTTVSPIDLPSFRSASGMIWRLGTPPIRFFQWLEQI
jgi:hypothetical protein